jgi:uncharacterized membrane protein (UPF0127 family)
MEPLRMTFEDSTEVRVLNLSKRAVLVERGRIAETPWTRVIGLLRHSRLEKGDGLWIKPCNAIHSMGMRFRFDAVFLDANHHIVHQVENMGPWRATRLVWRARSVLELPAFTLQETGTELGDQLQLGRLRGFGD